jgi:hypothetical protein
MGIHYSPDTVHLAGVFIWTGSKGLGVRWQQLPPSEVCTFRMGCPRTRPSKVTPQTTSTGWRLIVKWRLMRAVALRELIGGGRPKQF